MQPHKKNSTILVHNNFNSKGDLTGCGHRGYSIVFSIFNSIQYSGVSLNFKKLLLYNFTILPILVNLYVSSFNRTPKILLFNCSRLGLELEQG